MKGCLSALMFLIVVLVVCTARAQEPEPSLGDVARQNRAQKKAESIVVVTDQTHDVPVKNDGPGNSVCGEPVPIMQRVYVSALAGQPTPPEDEIAKELLGWLRDHPDLQQMDPDDLAKAEEPRNEQQEQQNKELANKIAQSFTEEMESFKVLHSDEEVKERINKLMSAPMPQRQADVLASAVRDEKRRRAEMEGKSPSDKDDLEQAINTYAICENKRLIVSQSEVEKLTKSALKEKLAAAGFVIPGEPIESGK
jgi:hypothetical protein